jgi:hypothetical protein
MGQNQGCHPEFVKQLVAQSGGQSQPCGCVGLLHQFIDILTPVTTAWR